MSEQPIRKGQVWRSKDRRDHGRTVTVEDVAASVNEPGNRGFVAVRSVRRSVMRANTLRTRYELLHDLDDVAQEFDVDLNDEAAR